MKTMKQDQSKKQSARERNIYESPAIIHESLITTRAGSPIEPGSSPGVDPADLFGS
jgi:hypothetical protein